MRLSCSAKNIKRRACRQITLKVFRPATVITVSSSKSVIYIKKKKKTSAHGRYVVMRYNILVENRCLGFCVGICGRRFYLMLLESIYIRDRRVSCELLIQRLVLLLPERAINTYTIVIKEVGRQFQRVPAIVCTLTRAGPRLVIIPYVVCHRWGMMI